MPADNSAAAAIIGNHVRSNRGKDKSDSDTDKNDLSDWQRLPDLPTSKEILINDSSNNLPWFPINHVWKAKAEYIEALYKILRFEGVEGLRYSVKTVRDSPNMDEDDNTCIYTKVHIKGYLFAKLGPIARISFSTARAGVKIKWKQSKRLQPGKAVALSTDFFKTDCRVAVIAQRPIEGGLDQSPPIIDIIWASADQALIDPDQEVVMVESRNGYYEAVRHTLKGLQHAAREWSPLDKYVVSLDRSDLPVSSISKDLNLSSLVDHLPPDESSSDNLVEQELLHEAEGRFRSVDHEVINKLSDLKPYTSLDESQLDALNRIMTKEIAIIQGPPGTGKTFTSVKSITTMLQNRRAGDPPIIVSAQTNHALDQLLIYCKSAGANIMRVGGRTDNDEIAQRTMYELRQAARVGGPGKHLDKQRHMIIDRFEGLVQGAFGGTELLDPQILFQAGVLTETQYNSLSDADWEADDQEPAMESWLGGEKIERIRQVDDFDFDEFEAPDEIELVENLDDEQVDDDDDPIRGRFVPLSSRYTGQRPQIASWESRCRMLLKHNSSLYDIPRGYRGGVYLIMELKLREATAAKFRDILDEAIQQSQEFKASGWIRDLRVIDRHCVNIIGCTTTGLTKYRGFLAAVQPRILLIEEAAETREANVASALFPSLQQLILVGDHQQLPPSCEIARLAKHPYNLNVSLFERLVSNGLPFTMLNQQRRMAPELRTIVQQFYSELKDHPLVTDIAQRPLIPGLGDRRSWFFTHQWPEDTDADNSKFNQSEVEVIVAFVRYLMHNGVGASEITILTYYKGQKRKLIQHLRQKFPTGKFFNVATVDSYQGEENEIVILSLVRSPGAGQDYRVGFLDSRNRATVAISRARRGFFMFGNKENMLWASEASFLTWVPVWNAFAEQHRVAMGRGMPLVCQNHGREIWVKDADDLVGNAGGCWTRCDGKLGCGHACDRMCHITCHDLLHCSKPCHRTLECGHKCAGDCSDPCQCAINCPEYIQIRLRLQLAQAQLQNHAQLPDTRTTISAGLTASTSVPNPADWEDMVRDPGAYDRRARVKAMGDVRLSEDMFRTAFGGINETYFAVSDRNGRRVRGATGEMGILEAEFPRLLTSGIADSEQHSAPHANSTATSPRKSDTAQGKDRSLSGRNLQVQASTGRRLNPIDVESQTDADAMGGRRNRETRKANHPTTINTVVANANASTVRARYNVDVRGRTSQQVGGGAYSTTMPTAQQSGNGPEMGWSLLLQDTHVPDSASIIGGLGFDEELSQATRRVKQLQMTTDRNQALQRDRSYKHHHEMLDGAESLIDFGVKSADPVVGRPAGGQVCDLPLKKAESLIDYDFDKA